MVAIVNEYLLTVATNFKCQKRLQKG